MVNQSFLNLKKMNWIRCLEGSEDVEGSGSEQKIVTTSVLFDKAYSATKKGEKISLFVVEYLLLFKLNRKIACQFHHLFHAFFRQISFLKFCKNFR